MLKKKFRFVVVAEKSPENLRAVNILPFVDAAALKQPQ